MGGDDTQNAGASLITGVGNWSAAGHKRPLVYLLEEGIFATFGPL